MENIKSISRIREVFKTVLIISLIFVFAQNIKADEQTDLKNHFLNKIDEIILIVQDKALSKSQRNENIVNVLTPTFDFELMAKLSLGETWKRLVDTDREKFVKLYVKRMENSYSSKLDSYSNEKVVVNDIKQPKKDRMYLITDLASSDEKLDIVYKFYKPSSKSRDKDTWLIYDVEIMGVSILKTDKAQFKEYLQGNSFSDLMSALAK